MLCVYCATHGNNKYGLVFILSHDTTPARHEYFPFVECAVDEETFLPTGDHHQFLPLSRTRTAPTEAQKIYQTSRTKKLIQMKTVKKCVHV